MGGLFCHAQRNTLAVLERSKAMETHRAVWSASRLALVSRFEWANLDVDQYGNRKMTNALGA